MFNDPITRVVKSEYLAAVERVAERESITSYRYDSFASLPPIEQLIASADRTAPSLPITGSALDLGAGDGALSFLLERHGFSVTSIDCSATNINNMRMLSGVKEELGSAIRIEDMNIDQALEFSSRQFDLTLALGLLYHLKNPWLVLETLARHSHFCLLSSRIIDYLADGTRVADAPVSLLLSSGQIGGDTTNTWLYTQKAIELLAERSHWRVLASHRANRLRRASIAPAEDERLYVLLASQWSQIGDVVLREGWHPVEQNSFRWSARTFAVESLRPLSGKLELCVKCYAAPELISNGPVHLVGSIAEDQVADFMIDEAGEHTFFLPVTAENKSARNVKIDFEVRSNHPSAVEDQRELGLIFSLTDGESFKFR